MLVYGIFIFMVGIMFWTNWYTKKHKTKINAGQIVIAVFTVIFISLYFIFKNMGTSERDKIVKNISLKTTVEKITFDPHKPYFKDMSLADGQFLPMPEAMNNSLQVGDSIYKTKGENFYTVINFKTKTSTTYEVKIHERVLGKAQ